MTASRPPARARLQSSTPAGGVAAALLAQPASTDAAKPDSEPASTQASKQARKPAAKRTGVSASERTVKPASQHAARLGVSDLSAPRVRTRARFVEPLSTRLTPEMRAAVDKHVAETGEAQVDLVDRALRLALGMTGG